VPCSALQCMELLRTAESAEHRKIRLKEHKAHKETWELRPEEKKIRAKLKAKYPTLDEDQLINLIRGFERFTPEELDTGAKDVESWNKQYGKSIVYEPMSDAEKIFHEAFRETFHGTDKWGHPVQVINFAKIDYAKVGRVMKDKSTLVRIQSRKLLASAYMKYRISKCLGRRVRKSIFIMDLDGLSLWTFYKHQDVVKGVMEVGLRYFPETLLKTYLVNPSNVFYMVWKIAKIWLDPVTLAGINVCGNLKEARKLWKEDGIDIDALPEKLGGQNKGAVDLGYICETVINPSKEDSMRPPIESPVAAAAASTKSPEIKQENSKNIADTAAISADTAATAAAAVTPAAATAAADDAAVDAAAVDDAADVAADDADAAADAADAADEDDDDDGKGLDADKYLKTPTGSPKVAAPTRPCKWGAFGGVDAYLHGSFEMPRLPSRARSLKPSPLAAFGSMDAYQVPHVKSAIDLMPSRHSPSPSRAFDQKEETLGSPDKTILKGSPDKTALKGSPDKTTLKGSPDKTTPKNDRNADGDNVREAMQRSAATPEEKTNTPKTGFKRVESKGMLVNTTLRLKPAKKTSLLPSAPLIDVSWFRGYITRGSSNAREPQARKQQITEVKPIFIGISGASGSGLTTLAEGLAEKLRSPVVPLKLSWFLNSDTLKDKGASHTTPRESSSSPISPISSPGSARGGEESPSAYNYPLLVENLSRLKTVFSAHVSPNRQLRIDRGKSGSMSISLPSPRSSRSASGSGSEKKGVDNQAAAVVVVIVEGILLYNNKSLAGFFDHKLWLDTPFEESCRRKFSKDPTQGIAFSRFKDWYKKVVWISHEKNKKAQLSNAGPSLCVLKGSRSHEDVLCDSLWSVGSSHPGLRRRMLLQ